MHYTATYSRHDGGWYAEVFDADGKDLHTTSIHATREQATLAASRWIDKATAKDRGRQRHFR